MNGMEVNRDLGRSCEGCMSGPLVSLFRGYADSRPVGVVSLAEFLFQTTFREQIEAVRRCNDKSRRRELKSKLPAITPSGTFSKRCNAGLIRHSGFICLDLDGKDNPAVSDWNALKSLLADFPGLWYGGLSVSGNGLFLLIKIAYPERHAEHFHALDHDLSSRGLVVDAACKDVARLRGTSYDPAPLYFPNAEPYEGLLCPTQTTATLLPQHDDLTAFRVAQLVETIDRTGTNIAERYPDWFAVGRSLAAEFGESGRGWFHSISRQSAKYNPLECDRQYTRCLDTCTSTSIRTLFWLCKLHGLTTTPLQEFP